MKFTYRVLGTQLGVQLDSLPAHFWKKAWGQREILFNSDDFHQKKSVLQWEMIENYPPSESILYCLVLLFLPSCCS